MITSLVMFVIYLLVLGVVCWLLLYLNDTLPVPEPFHRVIRIVIIVFGVLILILLLLGLIGVVDTGSPRLLRP
jgi:hypothetical protein